MTFKLILGICLVIIATLIGYCLSEKQKLHRNILSELITFNNSFMCDVGLYNYSVPEKIDNASEILQKTFFGATEALRDGKAFLCTDKRISEAERKLVTEYINGLGRGDSRSQTDSLKLFEEKLKSVFSSQDTKYEKCSKLYVKLGFSCGLLVFVLLM